MTRSHLARRKQQLYGMMYRFTATSCTACADSGCACKDTICAHVEDVNRARGIRFARTDHQLRFIGCRGCVVPPELRETCTLYICEAAKRSPNFDTRTYERITKLISKLEWQLMEMDS